MGQHGGARLKSKRCAIERNLSCGRPCTYRLTLTFIDIAKGQVNESGGVVRSGGGGDEAPVIK